MYIKIKRFKLVCPFFCCLGFFWDERKKNYLRCSYFVVNKSENMKDIQLNVLNLFCCQYDGRVDLESLLHQSLNEKISLLLYQQIKATKIICKNIKKGKCLKVKRIFKNLKKFRHVGKKRLFYSYDEEIDTAFTNLFGNLSGPTHQDIKQIQTNFTHHSLQNAVLLKICKYLKRIAKKNKVCPYESVNHLPIALWQKNDLKRVLNNILCIKCT